jgi:hypothetical protein
MSKRLRIPILLFLLLVTALLFFSDLLTGRVHHEFENPYSRTRKIVETQYGFTRERLEPSPLMEAVYYEELQQPREEIWVRRPGGYTIARYTGKREAEQGEVPPVVLLDSRVEADFLQYITLNPKVKLAVIQSLYTERKPGTDSETMAANVKLHQIESERVKTIMHWDKVIRKDITILKDHWWKDNAAKFGLTPEGAKLLQKVTAKRPDNEKKE